ncbi:MAG TPA: OsmC family peroxiredoxin [Gaiellaceae bacterium]|jgi:osmotically inducible protein OsmC|nr:OsmC family peroxiredoxin [Gaiellaceae bacterium]
MATRRSAEVEWIGGFTDGEGKIISTTSGTIPQLDVTWQARVDEDEPMTSPEELLAAAHASCYAMQLTSGIVGAGGEPEELRISCEVSFEVGLGITQSALTARITAEGLTDDQLREIAERAKIMCPISMALAGIDVTLDLPDLAVGDEDEAGDQVPAAAEE